jgi:hypothetical protein
MPNTPAFDALLPGFEVVDTPAGLPKYALFTGEIERSPNDDRDYRYVPSFSCLSSLSLPVVFSLGERSAALDVLGEFEERRRCRSGGMSLSPSLFDRRNGPRSVFASEKRIIATP